MTLSDLYPADQETPAIISSEPPTSAHRWSYCLLQLAWLGTLVRIFSTPSMSHPDIWWHLQNARQFLATAHFANSDIYSFTAAGSPWINHEWLSELLFYEAFDRFGWTGLYCFTLLLQVLFAFGVFWLAYRAGKNATAATLYSSLAVVLGTVNFGPRAILFGWLYLIALLLLLDDFRANSGMRVWFIPGLFALWINTHGSWLLGMAIFGLITVCRSRLVKGLNQAGSAAWSSSQQRTAALIAVSSALAVFINPYGYRLVFYPFQFMSHQQLNLENVLEWASVNFHDGRGKVAFVLLALTLVMFAISQVRISVEELAVTLMALYLGLLHVRFLMLTAILLAPIITVRIASMWPKRVPKFNWHAYSGLTLILCAFIISSIPSAATISFATEAENPSGALAFLKQRSKGARLFNYWEWGGYEIWKGGPPPFIDTRTDIFEYNGTLSDYLDTIRIVKPFEVLDKYKIDYVLFPPNTKLSYVLSNSPKWRVLYADSNSMVFGRN